MQKCRRNTEQAIDIESSQRRRHQQNGAQAAVDEQAGIDEPRQLRLVASGMKFGDVTNQRRSDAEVEDAVVTGQRKNQDPESEGIVPEMMQDERREKEADGDVHRQACPTRGYVF